MSTYSPSRKAIDPHTLEIKQALAEVTLDALLMPGVRKATQYLTPKLTIKATRQRKHDRRSRQSTLLVTVGTPNYFERRIIKAALKDGVAFPMKSTYHEFYDKRRK